MVVPLMMPRIEVISFADMSPANTPITGTPAATADSKRSAVSVDRANDSSRAPNVARSSLFAVTTGRPALSAASTIGMAGSSPPMSSTTTSTSSEAASAAGSVVSGAMRSRPAACAFARSRTAIPAMPIPHSSARLANPRATAAPTVPPPRSPIVSRSPCQPVCSAMG